MKTPAASTGKKGLSIREIAIFGMLGSLMYASKVAMEGLPNVHLLGVFTMALTLVYRKKALYPIYTYVFINGLMAGFNIWWVPYLYLWTILWGVTMLLPRKMPPSLRPFVYMFVCGMHGILFGTMYAPAQALFFGYDLKKTIAWIIAGLPWDAVHGVGNFFLGALIIPLAKTIELADRQIPRKHSGQ